MKNLYLIRHASAEDVNGGMRDQERALTASGMRDANHLGMYFSTKQINPDFMITSTATRAIQTAEMIAEQIKYSTDKIEKSDDLYEAPIRTLIDTINAFEVGIDNAMMVAHNPAISFLADYLTGEPIGNMSPCTVIGLSFEVKDWNLITSNMASTLFIRTPN